MELLKASSILFVLLNPFLISIYLISLIRDLSFIEFTTVMIRAHVISGIVFVIFAITGEGIFENIFNVRFGAFFDIWRHYFFMDWNSIHIFWSNCLNRYTWRSWAYCWFDSNAVYDCSRNIKCKRAYWFIFTYAECVYCYCCCNIFFFSVDNCFQIDTWFDEKTIWTLVEPLCRGCW